MGCLMSDFSVAYENVSFVCVETSQVKMHQLQTYPLLCFPHLSLLESPTGRSSIWFPFWGTRLSPCTIAGSERTPGHKVPFWNQNITHWLIKCLTSHLSQVYRGRDLLKDHSWLVLLRICLRTLGYSSLVWFISQAKHAFLTNMYICLGKVIR